MGRIACALSVALFAALPVPKHVVTQSRIPGAHLSLRWLPPAIAEPQVPAARPGAVRELTAGVSSNSITLSWSPPLSSGGGVLGYLVLASGGAVYSAPGTTIVINGLSSGWTGRFAVTAYSARSTGPAVTTAPMSVAPSTVEPSVPAMTQSHMNYLRADDGSISTPVGFYYSLSQSVPSWEAVLDTRMKMVQYYFDGHNPGIFTPLLSEQVGSTLTYWDGQGRRHRFRIIAVRSWDRYQGEPPPVSGSVVAQFQTCRTADGSVDWIYDAVAA